MLGALLKGFSDFGIVRRAIFFRSAVPKEKKNRPVKKVDQRAILEMHWIPYLPT